MIIMITLISDDNHNKLHCNKMALAPLPGLPPPIFHLLAGDRRGLGGRLAPPPGHHPLKQVLRVCESLSNCQQFLCHLSLHLWLRVPCVWLSVMIRDRLGGSWELLASFHPLEKLATCPSDGQIFPPPGGEIGQLHNVGLGGGDKGVVVDHSESLLRADDSLNIGFRI